jgi:hypothetical protein
MITIENGKLTIEMDSSDLQKNITAIEWWKVCIIEILEDAAGNNLDIGAVAWFGEMLKTLRYDTDFIANQLSKPE